MRRLEPESPAEVAVLAATAALARSNILSGIVSASGLTASGIAATAVGLAPAIAAVLIPLFPIVAGAAVGAVFANRSRQKEKRRALEEAMEINRNQVRQEVLDLATQVLRESSGDLRPTARKQADSTSDVTKAGG